MAAPSNRTHPTPRGMRVLLYSHDSFGLGHFRRTSSIAHAIARECPGATTLCVTGSPRPDLFPLPEGADYVKLPSVTKNDEGSYVAANLRRDLQGIVQVRSQTLRAAAASFQPDVVLVDHAPVGVGGELLPMLREQSLRDDVRIVLGLRDILDAPERARREMAEPVRRAAMHDFYDQILVYGQPEICDVAAEYELDADLARKIQYVGIVCGPVEDGRALLRVAPQLCPHVLVTAGGGADGAPLLGPAVDAIRELGRQNLLTATVVGGPLLDRAACAELDERTRNLASVRFVRSLPHLHRVLRRSELVIGMGGYNSIYESLGARVRMLVLPRVQPRREQLERVQRLERLGLLHSLDPSDLETPRALQRRILDVLAAPSPDPQRAGLRLEGARRTALQLARWHRDDLAPLRAVGCEGPQP